METINLTRRAAAPAFAAAALMAAAVPAAAVTVDRPAGTHQYYVGIDDFPTLASGTYAGLPNPNFNRLTFLWADWFTPASDNHYHSKATFTFTYTGPAGSPTVVTSSSNYVPEAANPPVRLSDGAGIYAGKRVSNPYNNGTQTSYFSNFTVGNTRSLNGFAPTDPQTYMLNSSGGRWNSAFNDADVHLELVSLTPGLKVGSPTALTVGLVNPGDELHLGEGSQSFSFAPTLYVEPGAALGTYVARFKLTDESNTFGDSGVFEYRVEAVPEPGVLGSAGVATVGLLARRGRRKAAAAG